MKDKSQSLASVKICAGAGDQAPGLELAGVDHQILVEIEASAQKTLKLNRPHWSAPANGDVAQFSGKNHKGADIPAGGLLCPPFSKAGKQSGGSIRKTNH